MDTQPAHRRGRHDACGAASRPVDRSGRDLRPGWCLGCPWFAAEPSGQPAVAYLGQFFGAESVLLLSIGLVLISTLPWCEAMFDGIDRAAIWHRRVAITGMILLVPHIVLSANPHRSSPGPLLGVIGAAGLLILAVWAILPRWRSVIPRVLQGPVLAVRRLPGLRHLRRLMGGYELWRSMHRLTGLFVAAGFAHGLLDGTPFPHAQVLGWTFVAIGGTGLAFYLYRELLARYFVQLYDYQVARYTRLAPGSPRSRWLRSAARPPSRRASSPCSTWRPSTAGTGTRSPSPALRVTTFCPSPSRHWAMTPPSCPAPYSQACPR